MKQLICLIVYSFIALCIPATSFAEIDLSSPFNFDNSIKIEQNTDSISTSESDKENDDSVFGKVKSLWGWGKKKVSSTVIHTKRKWDEIKHQVTFGWGKAKDFLRKISNFSSWFKQDKLSNDDLENLKKIAKENQQNSWSVERDISEAENAHYTNTRDELKEALESKVTWLECDVRLEGPFRKWLPFGGDGERRPITAHDSFQTNGLLFEDWVKVTSESGRGLKIDLKENAALEGVLATLDKYDVADEKLIMNIGVSLSVKDASKDERLSKIRQKFPNCIVNLSPGGSDIENGHYGDKTIAQLIAYAKAVEKPVMFPLRAELVTPEIVASLKPYGKIAIWNSARTYNPVDVNAEIEKFRQWGVDGMIDIMTDH